MDPNWLEPGYYKIRLRAKGPWVPIEIEIEDGERDPDTWELLSDQKLRAVWYPRTDSMAGFSVPAKRFLGRAFPITRSEFLWLMSIKTILV